MVVGIGWTAGAVRARLLSDHRLGPDAAGALARRPGLEEALTVLKEGPYAHDVTRASSLADAQWAVGATPLWNLRILAGWLPPRGTEAVRVLAGWWEVLNVENHLTRLAGSPVAGEYALGRLDTAWARLREADSVGAVRGVLAASPWLDPGTDDVAAMLTWLRLSWARRVAAEIDDGARLAAGWAALVLARDLLQGARTTADGGRRAMPGLGNAWAEARVLPELLAHLPAQAAWVFAGVTEPVEIWRAEVGWWRTLDAEGDRLVRHPTSGVQSVLGAFALLLADAHRVQGALALAARGGATAEETHDLL